MSTIPVITGNAALFERLRHLPDVDDALRDAFVHVRDVGLAVDLLRTELPELSILDLDPGTANEALDPEPILAAIREDPWLCGGGILALARDPEPPAEAMRGTSLLAVVPKDRVDQEMPVLLRILAENRRLLLQRALGTDLVPEVEGRFVLDSDPVVARCHENLICNFLCNANRIDADTRDALAFAMHELLLNAIEHGNCGITYDEKCRWLAGGGNILDLIEARCSDPEVAARRVTLEYQITPRQSRFRISDEGKGFDWRLAPEVDAAEALLSGCGRGLAMTRGVTERLVFNERGNVVTFEVAHQQDVASATPALVEGLASWPVVAGEVVCREGDPADALYFITRGRYEVLVGDRRIAVISPDDLIIGEMSFLLRNQRNATVRALTDGVLVPVSNARFVQAIRERPYYALMLARLLAGRLRFMLRAARQVRVPTGTHRLVEEATAPM